MELRRYPAAMTVAGSDSGGGAGIQADLRTFSYFRVFGTSAITAVTFQNPLEVTGIEPVSPDGVRAQIETVRRAVDLTAVKTGMLFSAGIIEAVTDSVRDFAGPLVVDPVMVSTSGRKLLRDDAIEAMCTRLLPLASWITPNLPEAEVLVGHEVGSGTDAVSAARECAARWNCSVVLKGGHAEGPEAGDVVVHQGHCLLLSSPRVPIAGNSDHGTGCTFSSALTAQLALGTDWQEALVRAKAFVLASLTRPVRLSDRAAGMFPPEEELSVFSQQITCREIES
ncbi:MAG: bifunctional hydroxymethylpyrimidine kinase/phosphomethylpyrimidine kinase [Lentisphaeria bacterium]|nr:bifunctional hydroxymethylpyrimidine kinase/phosphomethylpyrimidine kinase [Lentisphaeria bacterium]